MMIDVVQWLYFMLVSSLGRAAFKVERGQQGADAAEQNAEA
jgi:hypothetical protein